MSTVIAVEGIGRCDARCYDAGEEECDCICGGENHGVGRERAMDNAREHSPEWLEKAKAEGKDISSTELAMDAQCVPLFGLTEASAPMGNVIYHGTHNGSAGAGAVEVVEDGRVVGLLHHDVRHSPTGFSWGYAGSGPADLARSLLIAALGDKAKCPTCEGCGRVAWLLDESMEDPVPFDAAISGTYDPDSVGPCYECDGGYRHLPYQDFKFQFVAGWGDDWQISRDEIRAWYATQPQ